MKIFGNVEIIIKPKPNKEEINNINKDFENKQDVVNRETKSDNLPKTKIRVRIKNRG